MNVLHIVGTRPNLVKLVPVYRALAAAGAHQLVVHTGQHHDAVMSAIFFDQFGLPQPTHNLGVAGGSHTEQTARTLLALEPLLVANQPDWVVLYGDVNATLAGALAAAKLGLRMAHVEAGLRSFDRTMPEELNRLVVDRLADLLLTPSEDANAHLRHEGVPEDQIVFVGNVMIDTLLAFLPQARQTPLPPRPERYLLATLHRPGNVDTPTQLLGWLTAFEAIATHQAPVIFPVHPRTRQRAEAAGWAPRTPHLHLWAPQGYLEFLRLQAEAALVLTDSGGVQEETTALGVKCLTLRPNTERPVTLTHGTSRLFPLDPAGLPDAVASYLAEPLAPHRMPPLWDGHAAQRVAAALLARP